MYATRTESMEQTGDSQEATKTQDEIKRTELIPISKVFLTKLRGMLRVFWGKWIVMLILSLIAGLVRLKML
ncbi:hypothetical protein PCC7811_00001 [Planktothrix agardhii]|nr:hypothetical protein PCC7811_00001 [Planktothrix agardhii]